MSYVILHLVFLYVMNLGMVWSEWLIRDSGGFNVENGLKQSKVEDKEATMKAGNSEDCWPLSGCS